MRRLLLHLGAVAPALGPPAARAGACVLNSPAFSDHGTIPTAFPCSGAGAISPLAWHGAPRGTQARTRTVTDPDARDPSHPTHTFAHRVIHNLPATADTLAGGHGKRPPAGAVNGFDGNARRGSTPPCSPIGRHRCFFRPYALTARIVPSATPDLAALHRAMRGPVLARAVLVGTYAHSE